MSATDEALSELHGPLHQSAVLDRAHIGDINGAFGTIRHGDHGPRVGWRARVMTLLAILGPGLIVMVGDNDAGAFSTYTQAGQNYGTALLWTLMLLKRMVNGHALPVSVRFRSGCWRRPGSSRRSGRTSVRPERPSSIVRPEPKSLK